MSKKRIFALITSFALVGTLVAPLMSSAMTAAEMEALIDQLTTQIAQLQSQLGGMTGDVTTPAITGVPAGFTFAQNLRLGSSGDDVKYLQVVLNSDAATQVAASGVGSPGQETSYFGPLTETAVIKFQNKYATEVLAPHGLTAGTGFVGTTTRAKLNDLLVAATEPVWDDEDEDEDEEDEEEWEEPEVTGLEVAYAASHPSADYIIVDAGASAETMKLVGAYTFSADGAYKVTDITLTRKGFVTDGDIDNLYLYVDGALVSDYTVNTATRKFKFSDAAGLFTVPANGLATVSIYLDIDNAVAAAQTVGFDILAATDVVTDAPSKSGFPLSGPMMTVVDADLATVDVDIEDVDAEELNIGADNVKLAEVDIDPDSDVLLQSITFEIVGTLSSDDLSNFELVDEDDDVIASASSMTSGKRVAFTGIDREMDGKETFEIKGDINGGAARTFQFTIDATGDVLVTDHEYGVSIQANIDDQDQAAQIIAAGDFTVERASDSPIGNIANGSDGIVLARYEFTAGGERTRIDSLSIENADPDGDDADLADVRVLVDGSQKGDTDDVMPDETESIFDFGNTFTIEVGETVVVEIVADIEVTLDDQIQIVGGDGTDDDIVYTLLDSDQEAEVALPDGFTLVAAEGSLGVNILSSPESAVLAMGKTYTVGSWLLEAEDEDVELHTIDFIETAGVLEDNVNSATLQLLDGGGTVVEDHTRSIAGTDDKIWFGNEADADGYNDEDTLDWVLEEGENYSLSLQYTFIGYADGFGATTGYLPQVQLNDIDGDGVDTGEAIDATHDSTANEHELRAAVLSVEQEDFTASSTPGLAREVLRFSASAEADAEDVTFNAFTLTMSSDHDDVTGTGELVIRKSSANGAEIAALRNETPTDLTVAVTDNQVDFGAAHGLAVGDVFVLNDGGADPVNVVVTAVTDAEEVTAVQLTDGSDIDDDDNDTAAAGAVAFLAENTLYVPVTDAITGTIADGSSADIRVFADTTGIVDDENVGVRIEDPEDIDWTDGAAASITSEYIAQFPIDELIEY